MYFARKTFELGVCLAGYWQGIKVGGWGGGVLLAFVALCATSWGWDWFAQNVLGGKEKATAQKNFIFGAISSAIVAVVSYALWGRY
jgi:hypothetical protein